jgi:hypothetical protein
VDSADLPPLRSLPAGQRSFIASATSIVYPYHITYFYPFQGGISFFSEMGEKWGAAGSVPACSRFVSRL